MKKIFFLMAIMTVFTTVARDRLYIENFSIGQGETLTVPIQLDNDTVYCAFQTDLYLPEGLQVVMDGEDYIIDLTSRKDRTHSLSCYPQPDGAIRIYVSSQSVKPFSGNSGPIATIELTAAENVSNAVMTLRNSITVEESGQKHYLDDCEAMANPTLVSGISLDKTEVELYPNETDTLTATVTPDDAVNKLLEWTSSDPSVATVDQDGLVTAIAVGTATITAAATDGSGVSASCNITVKQKNKRGDVNGDDKVNVSDVTALINMILGVIPKDMTRADVNGDGKINVSDVTALVNIILGVI